MDQRTPSPFSRFLPEEVPQLIVWLVLAAGIGARMWEHPELAGEFAVSHTAQLSLLFWFAACAGMIVRDNSRLVRCAWTLAWLAFVAHVLAAFHFTHSWSHTQAYQHVAETGGFGEGIFVNYAFLALWTVDVAWWWGSPKGHQSRPLWIGFAWIGFMVFVTFNAGVVFESGLVRWAVAIGFVLLGYLWLSRRQSHAI